MVFMFSSAKSVRVAWIALFAVFFSGLSTTLAAYYFSDRFDFVSEICTISGIKNVVASSEDADHHVPGKADGGTYCAQCLASASAPVIETPPVVAMFAFVAGTQAMPAPDAVNHRPVPVLPPPSRGPPQSF